MKVKPALDNLSLSCHFVSTSDARIVTGHQINILGRLLLPPLVLDQFVGDEEGGEAPEEEAGAQHHPPPASHHHV